MKHELIAKKMTEIDDRYILESDPDTVYTCLYSFPTTRARFVKVKALSERSLPSWHGAKGKEGFLFVDEIMVE